MVYKVYGKTGKAHLFFHWKKKDELGCVIDNASGCPFGNYRFDFKQYDYSEIENFFNSKNINGNLIYLYSNSTYLELKDFIDFLETLNHNFVIFIQE